jgi:mRNA-degrading endonuclease RelE of RelBE toxin-antitoxin system
MTIIMVIMPPRPRFVLVYAPRVKQHLQEIDPQHHSLIRAAIEEQLRDQPDFPTRNRKPLRRPIVGEADWELRIGPQNRFRVFYRIDWDEARVRVLAIGVKERNRLLIGGEEIIE